MAQRSPLMEQARQEIRLALQQLSAQMPADKNQPKPKRGNSKRKPS